MLDALPLRVGKVSAAAVVHKVLGRGGLYVLDMPQPRQTMPQLVGDEAGGGRGRKADVAAAGSGSYTR